MLCLEAVLLIFLLKQHIQGLRSNCFAGGLTLNLPGQKAALLSLIAIGGRRARMAVEYTITVLEILSYSVSTIRPTIVGF